MNEFRGKYSAEVTRDVPPSNHGGKRLGAGRKMKLENQTIENIKRCAASTILKILRDSDNKDTEELRADISTKVILKAMPSHITSDGSLAQKTIVLMRNEKSVEANKALECPPKQ